MKEFKVQKIISIICCLIGIALSLYGLVIGLESLNATGLGRIGVIFIWPSALALIIILFDLLIAIDMIKRGLIYSYISCLIKIAVIVYDIPSLIRDIIFGIKNGFFLVEFNLAFFAILIIITIPSILNIKKIISRRKKLSDNT